MAILLYDGERFDCILSNHAADQVGMSSEDDDFPETLFGYDTTELLQRIARYCDNPGDLVFEIEYNCEGYPWFAIKTQRPSSLRAYFRHFDANERQMVITHFAKKEQQKLKDSDKQQMYESYDEYARNGGY